MFQQKHCDLWTGNWKQLQKYGPMGTQPSNGLSGHIGGTLTPRFFGPMVFETGCPTFLSLFLCPSHYRKNLWSFPKNHGSCCGRSISFGHPNRCCNMQLTHHHFVMPQQDCLQTANRLWHQGHCRPEVVHVHPKNPQQRRRHPQWVHLESHPQRRR